MKADKFTLNSGNSPVSLNSRLEFLNSDLEMDDRSRQLAQWGKDYPKLKRKIKALKEQSV